MNSANTNPLQRNATWQSLPVEWLERSDALGVVFLSQRKTSGLGTLSRQSRAQSIPMRNSRSSQCARRQCRAMSKSNHSSFSLQHLAFSISSNRAFTILELMIVVGIIGLMAAIALPHLKGFTKANAMTAATRQMLDDVALARQRALVNRSMVCMVFSSRPNFWATLPSTGWNSPQITNLFSHQYSAYALISLRTVGDQPGVSNVHYLTDWKYLPQGVFISPNQFAPGWSSWVYTTNTTATAGNFNSFLVTNFATNISFPFPSTLTNNGIGVSNNLPYIGFTPSGQLTAGFDQYIMLTSGSILYPMNANGTPNFASPADVEETPPGNELSNPNLIHIDWLTARAKIERNQF